MAVGGQGRKELVQPQIFVGNDVSGEKIVLTDLKEYHH